MGFGPIPNILCAEIFPTRVRGLCIAICALTFWICDIIVTYTLPVMLNSLGLAGVFGIYAVVCFIAWVFVFLKVPETKGMPLEVIIEFFSVGAKQFDDAKHNWPKDMINSKFWRYLLIIFNLRLFEIFPSFKILFSIYSLFSVGWDWETRNFVSVKKNVHFLVHLWNFIYFLVTLLFVVESVKWSALLIEFMTIMAGVWWPEDFGMATTTIASRAMYDSWAKASRTP